MLNLMMLILCVFINCSHFLLSPSGTNPRLNYGFCRLSRLTLSLLMFHICGVSKIFGEWHQKTNKTEDTNKLTLLAFKIIIILHNTRLATFIKLLETVSKGLFRNRSQNNCHTFLPPYGGSPSTSVPCRRLAACTRTLWFTWKSESQVKLTGYSSPVIPSFTNRGLSCRMTWSASGDEGRN
jgi:hypothetical protein